MHGLKQAGNRANKNLEPRLSKYGYKPCKYTLGLWVHETRDIHFVLVVNDFGIKYTKEEDKNHLLSALQDWYTIAVDSTGSNYCGLTLNWDCGVRSVEISMPYYIQNLLQQLQFISTTIEHSPHKHNIPVYGKKVQYEETELTLPMLDKK